MLDYPGPAVSCRGANFDIIEQAMHASRAMAEKNKGASRYLDIARQFMNTPIRIGIIGEVNSGKTELANLILGVQFLPSSVINNTLCPTLIRFGEVMTVRQYQDRKTFDEMDASDLHKLVQRNGHVVECRLPRPLLKSIEIIDFPSFENFDPYHENSWPLLRRNDLLVWCSSSIRTWTASEKTAWERLPGDLRQYCLFVVTHADKLAAPALDAVMERLRLEAGPFGVQPIPISTTSAIQARSPRGQIVNRNLWETSGGAQFFKKLGDLSQQSISKRQQHLESSVEAVTASTPNFDASQLLADWDRLRQRFVSADNEPEELDTIMQAIRGFKIYTCKPWLQSRNRPENEIDEFLDLFPNNIVNISSSGINNKKRISLIFHQIKSEFKEYIRFIDTESKIR